MKINRFKFENKNLEFIIEPVCFSNLSLLVGGSGVGKSLILQSLLDLKRIAQGLSLDGAEWEIQFSIESGKACLWKGAFEKTGIPEIYEDETTAPRPKIIYENLLLDGHLVVKRKENEIKLQGESTPKLPSYQSALHLFNEEEIIFPIVKSINKIIRSVDSVVKYLFIAPFDEFLKSHNTLEHIQSLPISIYSKLALAYKNKVEVFDVIRDHFINVFTQVEDIKLEPLKAGDPPHLQIKEKNVSNWILHNRISSGMFKTLIQISQLFLCAEGSVILIDEFENSLGINCIDALTENLLDDTRDLQFILPAIIPTLSMP